jgi:NAD-reducing hydrogenase large subunit
MHFGQVLQSHALHFFHLSSPDLLFGFDDAPAHRNIVGVIQDHPELARRGVLLRRYGQEVIRVCAGKRIHGTGASPAASTRRWTTPIASCCAPISARIIDWAEEAVALMRGLFEAGRCTIRASGRAANTLSLVARTGAGALRRRPARPRPDGRDHLRPCLRPGLRTLLGEQVKPWSYMKFPFIARSGPEDGWYRVGSAGARSTTASYIDTPRAEQARRAFMAGERRRPPVQAVLATHWARLIELLHCAEAIERLLDDPDSSAPS